MKKIHKLSSQQIRRFQKLVYDHYHRNKRKLPWRETRDPYRILLSELMLQQTQVTRVIEKYKELLSLFPTIESVARAPLRDILEGWQGLGYNRRAVSLKRLATIVVDDHGGKIPPDIEALQALPGVGEIRIGAGNLEQEEILVMRRWAESHGGALVLTEAPESVYDSFDPWGTPPAGIELQRRVVARFDPDRIINPGRLAGGL